MKLLFPIFATLTLVISQGFIRIQNGASFSTAPTVLETQIAPVNMSVIAPSSEPSTGMAPLNTTRTAAYISVSSNIQQAIAYAFGNPAGCTNTISAGLTANQMLANVQSALGDTYKLAERRQTYIWNGPLNTYMNVTQDSYVYEFTFNSFQPPLTYRADPVVTIFLNNGFVVWLRSYGDNFRLTAIPMINGVLNSAWADYVTAYWQVDGIPDDVFSWNWIKYHVNAQSIQYTIR